MLCLKKKCLEFIRASLNASETISLKPKNQRFCNGQRNPKYLPYHWDKGGKGESKPSLCSLIGWESSRHSLNQSNSKLKPVATTPPTFSRALSNLLVFASSSDWLWYFPSLWLATSFCYFMKCSSLQKWRITLTLWPNFKLKFPSFSYVIPATKSSQFLYSPNGKIT